MRKEYTNKGFWVNIRLIRYADVLLMGAESANEKGIPGEAIDYLEQVRARARGTNTNILPKVTTTDQGELREAIRHERRVELGLEFDRFYDLVRWGIAKKCCTQPVKPIIRTKTHCFHCRRQRSTSLKEC